MFRKPVIFRVDEQFLFAVWSLIDAWTIKEVIIDKHYERQYQIQSSDVVVDIGAAIGEFAIPASARAKRVLALECDENRLQLLERNVLNNSAKNVAIIRTAAKSLDTVLASIARCDLLKVDCEGCEYGLFRNASSKTLAKVSHIAMEIHVFTPEMQTQYQQLRRKLTSNGFSLTEQPNEVHDYILYLYADKNADKRGLRARHK